MSNKYIIVYNIANIDSTMAAGWLYENLKESCAEIKAFPASNKIEIDKDSVYFWVGVAPSVETLEYFLRYVGHVRNSLDITIPKKKKEFKKRIKHYAYSDSKLTANIDEYFTLAYLPEAIAFCNENDQRNLISSQIKMVVSDGEIVADTLLKDSIMKAVFSYRSVPRGPALEIASNVIDFQYGLKQISIKDQAAIYKNYTAAIETLSHGVNFAFISATEEDERIYLDFLKTIKRQINTIFETSPYTIDNRSYQVPTINVNQTLSPWVLKLLSNHYDYAITYEQRRNNSIFTVFSRVAGFDQIVLKEMKAGKIPCRLSNQL